MPAAAGQKSWALLARVVLAEGPLTRNEIAAELFGEADDPLGALRWCLAENPTDVPGAPASPRAAEQRGEHPMLSAPLAKVTAATRLRAMTLPVGTAVACVVLAYLRRSWTPADQGRAEPVDPDRRRVRPDRLLTFEARLHP